MNRRRLLHLIIKRRQKYKKVQKKIKNKRKKCVYIKILIKINLRSAKKIKFLVFDRVIFFKYIFMKKKY